MQGNVWEWVADRYGGYDGAPAVDPAGPGIGELRVRRGGAWSSAPESCRLAHRSGSAPTFHRNDGGFRVAAAPVR
jgi:formylglycine-generating enzyme required for sulfatase activity